MSNILNPELVWIEGRCYRAGDTSVDFSSHQEHDLYESEMPYNDGGDKDEIEDDDVVITMLSSSRYSTSLHVPKHYLGSVIGKKGAVKMRLERETKCEIKIPKHNQPGDVLILGPSESNVKRARRRINMIVLSSRMKQSITHFISIPMNNSEIIENFEKFKQLVLQDNESSVDDSLFIAPTKLHLTLTVMTLMDNEERLLASNLLKTAAEEIIWPSLKSFQAFKVKMKGLSYMNDDPSKVRVLYAKVQDESESGDVLQKLSDDIAAHFYKAGFSDRKFTGNVKLHVTLMNTKYKSRTEEATNEQTSPRNQYYTFNAINILEKYSDYDFGVMSVNNLHLSQCHLTGPDGYYQSSYIVSCIPTPSTV